MVARMLAACACAFAVCWATTGRTQDAAANESRSTGQWRRQLEEWRKNVDMELARKKPPAWKLTGGQEQLAVLHERVSAIRDEAAVPALAGLLREEPLHLLRAIWLAPLPHVGSEPARTLLVKYSVEDDADYVRHAAAELLKSDAQRKDSIPDYVKYLRSPKFCTRAAIALRVSGVATRVSESEPLDARLVDALIDALILTAIEKVPAWYHQWFAAAMARPGGYQVHGRFERGVVSLPVKKPVENPEVRQTLKEYSMLDHGFDRESWRREIRDLMPNDSP